MVRLLGRLLLPLRVLVLLALSWGLWVYVGGWRNDREEGAGR